MGAGVVSADIHALDTAAFLPLGTVFFYIQGTAQQSGNQLVINTFSLLYMETG